MNGRRPMPSPPSTYQVSDDGKGLWHTADPYVPTLVPLADIPDKTLTDAEAADEYRQARRLLASTSLRRYRTWKRRKAAVLTWRRFLRHPHAPGGNA